MSRVYRRRPPNWLTAVLVVLVLLAARAGQLFYASPPESAAPEKIDEGQYRVIRVVDGDTLLVDPLDSSPSATGEKLPGPRARVRLASIDAPESVKPDSPVEPFGPESSAFTREFLAKGNCELRFGRRRVDQYDRFLAYVFVDDVMLNEALVREGLARAKVYPGDEGPLATRILNAQKEARAAKRGIWSQH